MTEVLEFLASLYHSGLSYSALNTARSALSSILSFGDSVPLGQQPLLKRFMRGVFNLRPAIPRYEFTWDVSKVLTYLKTFPTSTLKGVSLKLAMLLALLSGQRIQSLHLLDKRNIQIDDHLVRIRIGDTLKHTRPGKHQNEFVFKKYQDRDLCIVDTLSAYLNMTAPLRGEETVLFISFHKPHKRVSKDTIARWIKLVLNQAGIDTSLFKAHSVRSAATSTVAKQGLCLTTILRTAGWSKDSTFRKFYDRPITIDTSFSDTLLAAVD